MLGANREIFFPKLEEAQMMTFNKIAEKLIAEYGYDLEYCDSDSEAVDKAYELQRMLEEDSIVSGVRLKYPVYFSASDTSGEKAYEEFYTELESVDMNRFLSLGVVTSKEIPSKEDVNSLIDRLNNAFGSGCDKAKIVSIIGDYLPNFEHIETGKGLDGKM